MNTEQLTAISSYLDRCAERRKLEKTIAQLQKQLTDTTAKEEQSRIAVSPFFSEDNLFAGGAPRQINKLLSSPCSLRYHGELLPVASAKLKACGRNHELTINFAQPIFSGWRTENPLSYQSLRLSLATPPAPSGQHVAMYLESDVTQQLDLLCWERANGELILYCKPNYSGDERAMHFVLDGGILPVSGAPAVAMVAVEAPAVPVMPAVTSVDTEQAEQRDEFAAWLKNVSGGVEMT